MVGHYSSPEPATLFVESGGAIVPDRASEPSRMDAAFAETSFSIGHQKCGNAGASRIGANIELVQLGILQQVKADRCPCCRGYAHTGRSSSKSILKALQRTQPGKFRRYDLRMRVLPAVEPDPRQLADLG